MFNHKVDIFWQTLWVLFSWRGKSKFMSSSFSPKLLENLKSNSIGKLGRLSNDDDDCSRWHFDQSPSKNVKVFFRCSVNKFGQKICFLLGRLACYSRSKRFEVKWILRSLLLTRKCWKKFYARSTLPIEKLLRAYNWLFMQWFSFPQPAKVEVVAMIICWSLVCSKGVDFKQRPVTTHSYN